MILKYRVENKSPNHKIKRTGSHKKMNRHRRYKHKIAPVKHAVYPLLMNFLWVFPPLIFNFCTLESWLRALQLVLLPCLACVVCWQAAQNMVKNNHNLTCFQSAVVFYISEVFLRTLKESEKEYIDEGIKYTLKGKRSQFWLWGEKTLMWTKEWCFQYF